MARLYSIARQLANQLRSKTETGLPEGKTGLFRFYLRNAMNAITPAVTSKPNPSNPPPINKLSLRESVGVVGVAKRIV
jgi:hypothetical protein